MEDTLGFDKLYNDVVGNGYDFGTGSWAVVNKDIEMKMDEYGAYHPVSKRNLSDFTVEEVNVLKQVCLSTSDKNEDDISKTLFKDIPQIKYDKQLGYYSDLFVGHVVEDGIRENASSGGLSTWILKELLEKKYVDGIIHIVKTNNKNRLFEYGISKNIDEIIKGSKTRYYPVEYSEVMKRIKKEPGNYAIIGLPSYIMEIRLLMENDSVIRDRIKYTVGLVCGHQKTAKYADFLAWQCGIQPGTLEKIDFRKKLSNEPSSSYAVEVTGMVNGESKTVIKKMRELRGADWGQGAFKVSASDYTDDVYNETADITLGDAWLPEYTKDSKGNNIVIVRNNTIKELLYSGIADGRLKLDQVDKSVIKKSQASHYRHTHDELAYRLYKKEKKHIWHPIKRVLPSKRLSFIRSRIQDRRAIIAKLTSEIYVEAVKKNDISYFFKKLDPQVSAYRNLYRIKRIVTKLKKI